MTKTITKLPSDWKIEKLARFSEKKGKSVDPSKFPNEIFELYSVPSLENNQPEIKKGSEIGSSKKHVSKNSVLLCRINPKFNRVWVVGSYTDNKKIASSEWVIFPENYDLVHYAHRAFDRFNYLIASRKRAPNSRRAVP